MPQLPGWVLPVRSVLQGCRCCLGPRPAAGWLLLRPRECRWQTLRARKRGWRLPGWQLLPWGLQLVTPGWCCCCSCCWHAARPQRSLASAGRLTPGPDVQWAAVAPQSLGTPAAAARPPASGVPARAGAPAESETPASPAKASAAAERASAPQAAAVTSPAVQRGLLPRHLSLAGHARCAPLAGLPWRPSSRSPLVPLPRPSDVRPLHLALPLPPAQWAGGEEQAALLARGEATPAPHIPALSWPLRCRAAHLVAAQGQDPDCWAGLLSQAVSCHRLAGYVPPPPRFPAGFWAAALAVAASEQPCVRLPRPALQTPACDAAAEAAAAVAPGVAAAQAAAAAAARAALLAADAVPQASFVPWPPGRPRRSCKGNRGEAMPPWPAWAPRTRGPRGNPPPVRPLPAKRRLWGSSAHGRRCLCPCLQEAGLEQCRVCGSVPLRLDRLDRQSSSL